jgi:Spy/CpxP family protein refolding chaperone
VKQVAAALAASWLAATFAAAFPEGAPPHFEPRRPEEVIARNAAELGIADETVAQIRALGEQHRSERKVIVVELRKQKLALRTLLEGANPSEAEAIALARKIGTLETDVSVSRLTAMMRMHALLTPEQRAALHEKMRGRFAERRALLDAAATACEAEIAEHCADGDDPLHAGVPCVLHKRRAEGLTPSAACEAALRELPPPHFIRHRGPPHGEGEPFDVLVPAPPPHDPE